MTAKGGDARDERQRRAEEKAHVPLAAQSAAHRVAQRRRIARAPKIEERYRLEDLNQQPSENGPVRAANRRGLARRVDQRGRRLAQKRCVRNRVDPQIEARLRRSKRRRTAPAFRA